MEVILREDVPGLGIIGDVVRVKPGYARNYLLPRGLAILADRRNLKQLDHHKRVIDAKKTRERGAHEQAANAMDGLVLETEARAGRGGKLFGSVTNMDVQRLLKEKGFDLDRRRIDLKEHIKEIGETPVSIKVGQDIRATVTVVVKPVGGELEDRPVDEDEALEEEARAKAPMAPEPEFAQVEEDGEDSPQGEGASGEAEAASSADDTASAESAVDSEKPKGADSE